MIGVLLWWLPLKVLARIRKRFSTVLENKFRIFVGCICRGIVAVIIFMGPPGTAKYSDLSNRSHFGSSNLLKAPWQAW